jgi:hypothetical protein
MQTFSHNHQFVIAAYKDSPHLEECIRSLAGQTLPSPIALCTSTPSGFLEQLAQKYRLSYYVRDGIPSIGADWNFALAMANSRLVTIAHQDDVYAPGYVETVTGLMQKQKNALIAFTDYDEIRGSVKSGSNLNLAIKRLLLSPFYITGKIGNRLVKKCVLSFGDPVSCPTVTLNREKLRDFKFSEDLTCVLDWEAWWRLAQQSGSFVYTPQKLLSHRIHEASETHHHITRGIRLTEEKQMLQKIWGKNPGALISAIYKLGQKSNII